MSHSIWTSLKGRLRAFKKDTRGAIAVLLAVAIVPLVAILGLATDAARGYMVKARLSQAIDAAALAGGREIFESYRDADIQKYFDANFPTGYMGVEVTDLVLTKVTDEVEGTVTVTATATVDTTFLRVIKVDTVQVSARAVVQRAVRGMELVLVLDVTGSMNQNDDDGNHKMTSLKTAAHTLLDILFGENETVDDFWVGIVPFANRVNVNPHNAWLTDPSATWYGCTELRSGTADEDDTTPGSQPFDVYTNPLYDSGSSQYWKTIDFGCPTMATLPLTAEKTTIDAKIDELLPLGGTRTDVGMVWGWRVLSPLWRPGNLWGYDATLPLDYDTPLMEKVAIIMSDGKNEPIDGTSATTANNRLAAVCTAMKTAGITVYTITFDVAVGSTIDNLFAACASDASHHFNSTTGTDLEAAFNVIGAELSNLRLAE